MVETQDTGCQCTTRHIPKPTEEVVLDWHGGQLALCPTAAFNLRSLINQYEVYGGTPPGRVTKRYGKFIRDLAEIAYYELR